MIFTLQSKSPIFNTTDKISKLFCVSFKIMLSKIGVVYMKLSEAVSQRVNELLVEKDKTQYELYKLSGVSQSTISDIRLMKNNSVNLRIIYEITQGLNMDLFDFFNSPLFKGNNIID